MEVFKIEKKNNFKNLSFFSFAGYISERECSTISKCDFLDPAADEQPSVHSQCKEFKRDEYVSKVTIVTDLFFCSHP